MPSNSVQQPKEFFDLTSHEVEELAQAVRESGNTLLVAIHTRFMDYDRFNTLFEILTTETFQTAIRTEQLYTPAEIDDLLAFVSPDTPLSSEDLEIIKELLQRENFPGRRNFAETVKAHMEESAVKDEAYKEGMHLLLAGPRCPQVILLCDHPERHVTSIEFMGEHAKGKYFAGVKLDEFVAEDDVWRLSQAIRALGATRVFLVGSYFEKDREKAGCVDETYLQLEFFLPDVDLAIFEPATCSNTY